MICGTAKLCAGRGVACPVEDLVKESEPRNRMREIFTYGSVEGAPGNRCFYPELGFARLRSQAGELVVIFLAKSKIANNFMANNNSI